MTQVQDGRAKVKRGRQARNTGASQAANLHIGERIRIRRTLSGLSQSELGKALGLSFQQMQKYERGMSSIGAGQLCEVAKVLDVPVSFFCDGLDGVSAPPKPDAGEREDRFARHELEMLGHYRAVPDFVRDSIRALLGYLSSPDSGHGRDAAEGAAAKREGPAADTPLADGTGRVPTGGGTKPQPHRVRDESSGVGAGAEPDRQAAGELPGSAPPETDQARSAIPEQPVPAKRRRGRPRKDANRDTAPQAVDEPVPVRSRPREGARAASEAAPAKARRKQGAVRNPEDAVTLAESTGRSPADPGMPQPASGGGSRRKTDRGPRPADRPEPTTANGGAPADGNTAGVDLNGAGRPAAPGRAGPNTRGPRRAYGATWTPSDIGK